MPSASSASSARTARIASLASLASLVSLVSLVSLLSLTALACSNAPSRARAQALSAEASVSSSTVTTGTPAGVDRPRPPGFGGATAWLNVDHALTLDELKGRVVVVDFWTSCCINCLHTLPTLAAVEETFASDPVVVVGVHSPKFDAETERERLRAAVQEYGITHPVAIDGSMSVWNGWRISSWPSVLVLDTSGRVAWAGAGEPNKDELIATIRAQLAEGEKNRSLVRTKVAGLHPEKLDAGPLAFPGKVIALADGGLAISDTAHHRVVLTDAGGKTTNVIGSGLAGKTDGSFAEASFRKPQGLAELGSVLYVADTENHELRAIDRRAGTVTTVAGTGELGQGSLKEPSAARATALRSPWDLAAVKGTLYVALAGSHQIGAFDPASKTIRPIAGDGQERRLDGKGLSASFAQPSGLASDGARLFVADSETSSVRSIDLATLEVKTIVGKDLFVFGDVDGDAETTRLQHPIGIAFGGGALFVADTYNSKIKRIDARSGQTKTVLGGKDRKDLFEPAGLTVRGNELVVADTAHARLVVVPIKNPAQAHALVPSDLAAPTSGVAVAEATERPRARAEERLTLAAIAVPEQTTRVRITWKLPEGTGVNEDAPFRARFVGSEGLASPPPETRAKGKEIAAGVDVPIARAPGAKSAHVVADVDIVICDIATHRVCVPVRRELDLTLKFGGTAPATVTVPLPAAR
jgi:thiol-disulfide isomerase/thioredoxin